MSTVPPLGVAGTIGIVAAIVALIATIVLYHIWMDRTPKSKRE